MTDNSEKTLKDVYITSLGKFLPGNPISNDEMEDYLGLVGIGLDWIRLDCLGRCPAPTPVWLQVCEHPVSYLVKARLVGDGCAMTPAITRRHRLTLGGIRDSQWSAGSRTASATSTTFSK